MRSLLAVLGFLALAMPVPAAEPTRTKLFENERVTVFEVAFAPGDEEPEHTHQQDLVGIAISGQGVLSTSPDGKTETLGAKPGEVFFMSKGSTHRARNTSPERTVFRVVALK